MSAYFANLNRSKRSLALDLTRPEAGAVVDALLDRGDVVVHNYRRAVAERLGLDAGRVRARAAAVSSTSPSTASGRRARTPAVPPTTT